LCFSTALSGQLSAIKVCVIARRNDEAISLTLIHRAYIQADCFVPRNDK
jgi:hypothetical protein